MPGEPEVPQIGSVHAAALSGQGSLDVGGIVSATAALIHHRDDYVFPGGAKGI
jgi:hypothetical protein